MYVIPDTFHESCSLCKNMRKYSTYKDLCAVCGRKKTRLKDPTIICKCGCGKTISSKTINGKQREYIHGHNPQYKGLPLKTWNGYMKIYFPDHPFCDKQGYVRLYRLILESHWFLKYKRPFFILPYFIVHHKNGDKKDNSPTNLIILSRNEHIHLHTYNKELINRICLCCNKKQSREISWFKSGKNYLCNTCYKRIKNRELDYGIMLFFKNYF